MSPRRAQSDASINPAEIRNFLFCSAPGRRGDSLSLTAGNPSRRDDILFNVNKALPCFYLPLPPPRRRVNHFETGGAEAVWEPSYPMHIGRNWIYLFIRSNNRMYFPGEMWVLHSSEQSGRFTVHEHNYKHTDEIHTSRAERYSEWNVFFSFFFFVFLWLAAIMQCFATN